MYGSINRIMCGRVPCVVGGGGGGDGTYLKY